MNIQDTIFSNINTTAVTDTNTSPTNEHNTYFRCGTALKLTNTSLTTPVVKNSIYHRCSIDIDNADASGLSVTYCISNGIRYYVTLDSNSKVKVDPLFVDEDNNDFKLQKICKGYFIDSLATNLSDDSRDCGAWDESCSVSSDTWETYTFLDVPKQMTLEYKPVNGVSNEDLRGNLRRYADDVKAVWSFTFSDYVRRFQSFKLKGLLLDTGVKKLYPKGGTSIITFATTGNFDASALTFTLTTIGNNDPFTTMTDAYKGFWITITYSGTDYDYYISGHSKKVFSLDNKLGHTLGTHTGVTFAVKYMLVQNVNDTIPLSVANYLGFKDGQELQVSVGSAGRGKSRLEEYNGYTLTFQEVEEYDI